MALAIDASSPAVVQNTSATTTTASFSPPSASALVAFVMADAGTGATDEACTVSSTGGLAWTLAKRHNGSPGALVEVWSAYASSAPGSITVSVTDNKGSVAKRLDVKVFTGADPAVIGATNSGATSSIAYTSTGADSWGWSVWLGSGAPSAGSGQTLDDSTNGTGPDGDSTAVIKQNATTPTIGTTVTNSITLSVLHGVAVEILAASAAAGGPVPQPQISRAAVNRAGSW